MHWHAESIDTEVFAYQTQVCKPYGTLSRLLAWCQSQCTGEWRWEVDTEASTAVTGAWVYTFHFKDERDQLAFLLTWA